jgi:hypothetical protein
MIRQRRLVLVGVLLLISSFGGHFHASAAAVATDTLPSRIADADFWRLVSEFSEPTGTFLSDNFVSNEDTYQHVVPTLMETTGTGGVYLGVGPDQNFTYIVALRPRVAFIVDIRRQNLVLHLLYKAAIELSHDRVELLSRLFSRPRPAGVNGKSTPEALIDALRTVPPDEALFEKNLRAIVDRLVRHHHFGLTNDDLTSIEYVYTAFFRRGPDIQYSIPHELQLRFPSFSDLVRQVDGEGKQRSYLASEDNFRVLKDLEERNLIVPIVGDFAGDRALPAVGRYLSEHGATVSTFYTSNVEMYLFENPNSWRRFYANLAALPGNARTTLIRTYNLRNEVRGRIAAVRLATVLDSMQEFLRAVDEGRIATYADVIERSRSVLVPEIIPIR